MSKNTVAKVFPVYAVEKNGEYWRAHSGNSEAEVIGYRLVTQDGAEFLGGKAVLNNLDIKLGGSNPASIGFEIKGDLKDSDRK